MRILITGATGFIGRALVPGLLAEGHQLVAWVRTPERARDQIGTETELLSSAGGEAALTAELRRCEAVVNLAGEPIIGRRWTEARKAQLVGSRVGLTSQLVKACAAASPRPAVLISSSAVGVYGDRGAEALAESAAPGAGFLADLASQWEGAARAAEGLGVRVVLLRTGIVLGREGGALAPMLLMSRLGVGGPMGAGTQYVPWIHLHDVVRIVATAVRDARYTGPINVVAPEEATSRTLARGIGRALHRPAFVPAPAPALRIALGEAAAALLDSQRVRPQRLSELGFRFAYPGLESALADITRDERVEIGPIGELPSAGSVAGAEYLHRRPPAFELRAVTAIDVPLEQVFPFFSTARNLGLITPAALGFRIEDAPAAIAEGTTISYRIRVGRVPVRWRTRIVRWEPPRRFVDVQEQGPYFSWWHEHSFRADGGRTLMEDRVCYAPPVPGALGRLANRLLVAPMLRRIFAYRGDVIRLRFGGRA
jgi:uncharacterized protein (TIGR01777 family)